MAVFKTIIHDRWDASEPWISDGVKYTLCVIKYSVGIPSLQLSEVKTLSSV